MYISIGSRATRHYDLTSILCDSLPPTTLVLPPHTPEAYNELTVASEPRLLTTWLPNWNFKYLFIKILIVWILTLVEIPTNN